jgi:protein involved in polysaccharide export with SLBB domain
MYNFKYNIPIYMNFRRVFTVMFFLFTLLVTKVAIAQNYSSVKVDELSDATIVEMIKKAESIGYNDTQLEQMAAAQGMKAEEIQKLRLRVEKIRKQGASANVGAQSTDNQRQQSDAVGNPDKNNEGAGIGPKIFGSDLFRNGNITFEPNLRIATPKGYVIGPDDKLLIDLTGDNEVSYNLQVSAEGTISIQYLGRVAVGGLTIEQATSKIKAGLAKTYPSIPSGRTSVAVNLGNIKSVKVTLTGYLVKPGTYTLSSLSTVYNALYASGGPAENGSFRAIQIIRNNKIIATVDVYDFLLKGIQQANVRLQDQDIINVPVYNKRVEIVGEIKRSALFEVKDKETLQDVIDFAGGFSTQAYTARIKAFQNTDKERKIIDIAKSEWSNYFPQNGDKFIVEPILDRFQNRVEIIGAVFRPGVYELEKNLTLKTLIDKSEGLREDAFLNRGYINRLNADNTQALITFDLQKIMAGTASDIPLQREDKITINSLFDLKDEYVINIQGEVRAPGAFSFADNMTLESVIQMAGGFREGATPNRIEISRRVKNSDATSSAARTAEVFTVNVNRDLKLDGEPFLLKPFDIISVRNAEGYSVQKQVKLEGEVVYPGVYTIIRKDERISELIKRAGGLTPSAYADGASLKRPGATKVNPNDKNAINVQEEESKKLLNLKRLQESGVKDTLAVEVEQQLIQSDLVGISLVKILKSPLSKQDLIVEDGDVIRVPRTLQTVKVTGEVLNPNSIVYLPGKSLKQYINGAGGFTANARKGGAYIRYANGSAAAVSKFLFFNNYPIVKPGAEILVPKKAEREKISPQAWIGIGTGLASLAAIVVSLLR